MNMNVGLKLLNSRQCASFSIGFIVYYSMESQNDCVKEDEHSQSLNVVISCLCLFVFLAIELSGYFEFWTIGSKTVDRLIFYYCMNYLCYNSAIMHLKF